MSTHYGWKTLSDMFDYAHQKGLEAGREHKPQSVVFGSPSTPLGDDVDLSKPYDVVDDGVCGFAWVRILPGTCQAARFAKEKWNGRKGHPSGVSVFCHEFNQSMERKYAYALAFATVLCDYGFLAVPEARMD